jgi:anti-anti-sigma factor
MTLIQIAVSHDSCVLSVSGPRRIPLGGELCRRVRALRRAGVRALVIDLAGVPSIDAAGIGELVDAYHKMTAVHGTLRVVRSTRRVRKVLERVGLFDLLSARVSRSSSPDHGRGDVIEQQDLNDEMAMPRGRRMAWLLIATPGRNSPLNSRSVPVWSSTEHAP